MKTMRSYTRSSDEIRPLTIQTNVNMYAEGSVLISQGNTKVLISASVEAKQPPHLRHTDKGWLTAEYAMLPRATNTRNMRESSSAKRNGRTVEIQRLVGRALRCCVDLKKIGKNTITIDCDVIQADGGTRCASITGGYVALALALKKIKKLHALRFPMAAVSVGVVKGEVLADLDYSEDSNADTDMNLIMNDKNEFIEIQGSAEKNPFAHNELTQMLQVGKSAIESIMQIQQQAIDA